LSEISVVVLGILIALSGEQLIEMLHWHHQLKDTETSLTHELASNIEDSIARMRTMGCLERRLDEISSPQSPRKLRRALERKSSMNSPPHMNL
jgi:hypothetical protein